ncbi:MAG: TolC family protein [Candidatus Kapaibacterium sp.]
MLRLSLHDSTNCCWEKREYLLSLTFVSLLLLFLPIVGRGQGEELTLREAVRIGLEQNRRAELASLQTEWASEGATPGAAGLLPEVDLRGGVSGSLNNTRQEFVSGEVTERSGAVSSGYSLGVDANWQVFDGFASWRRLDLLRGEKALSTVAERDERERIATEIALAYLDIVLLRELISTAKESIRLSILRRDLAKDRVDAGASIRFEMTQAQVDLNSDSATLLRQELQLANAKIQLNRLLNRPPLTPFTPVDPVAIPLPLPSRNELREQIVRTNSAVEQASLTIEQMKRRESIVKSELYPNLSLNVGYDFVGSSADAGFLLSNRTSGLNYSLNATWNIFNGFATEGRLDQADILIRQSELRYAEAVAEAEESFETLYQQYDNQRLLAEFERSSITAAEENLQLASDRLELGAVTPLEVRQAQTRFIESGSRLTQAEYEMAILGLQLLRLSGDILKIAGE